MAAVVAFAQWDGTGEPPDGWQRARVGREPMRRRPGGDPAGEYLDTDE